MKLKIGLKLQDKAGNTYEIIDEQEYKVLKYSKFKVLRSDGETKWIKDEDIQNTCKEIK